MMKRKTAKIPKRTNKFQKMKIVCMGGGTQIPPLLLDSLRRRPVQVAGITSMVDCGGSGGYFRSKFNVLAPGDIRRHILGLSNAPQWKKELWKFRFGEEVFEDGHKGQVFANAFLAGLENAFGDYGKVLKFVYEFMELGDNRALPATVEQTHIIAELENGEIVKGEAEIDVPRNHDPHLKIRKVYLEPQVAAFAEAKKAILEADEIIIGPGDLYSSIVPCFLPDGIAAALKKTKAKKILICNTVTKLGETNGFSAKEFAGEVEKYMGSPLDYILYHNKLLDNGLLADFMKANPQIGGLIRVDGDLPKDKFIGKDIYKKNEFAYDSKKVIREIFKLIKK
jgi:uncharacterized cofD-like protein